MTAKLLFVLTIFSLTNSNCSQKKHSTSPADTSKVTLTLVDSTYKEDYAKTDFFCDTVYKDKKYKLTLTCFDSINHYDETIPNTLFTLSKFTDGKYLQIYSDSIFNKVQTINFADFNNDNIKDILVQDFSDIRSNWSFHLYLIDPKHDKLKKIKGFEQIKNPTYIPKYDLIDNLVSSGRDYTKFYKIQKDSIKDFDIIIYNNQDDPDGHTFQKSYDKAIKSILTKVKKSR